MESFVRIVMINPKLELKWMYKICDQLSLNNFLLFLILIVEIIK